MKTIRISRNNDAKISNISAATIGHYDGVHLGHQYVLRCLHSCADERGVSETMVITFDRHPRMLFDTSYRPNMLTTIEERLEYLEQCGIDTCVVLEFDEAMASLSARDFMQEILRDRLGVRMLLLGYDNHFGKRKVGEGFDDYRRYGEEMGIEVVPCDGMAMPDGTHYSSTVVRRLLAEGHCQQAMQCLGRPYSLRGIVVEGYHEGRKMGFPTANISVDPLKVIPVGGVYAVKVKIEGYEGMFLGMMNIGHRPTYGTYSLTIETNIFHFDDDIYGKTLEVFLYKKMREERRFESVNALVEQLRKDACTVDTFFR